MLLGLNGEVLSKLGTETPLERLRREANEICDLFPALQKHAYQRRMLFGPYSLDTFKSGRYAIEYSFEEHEPVPQLINVYRDNGVYSDDFVELVFSIGKERSMKKRLENLEQSKEEHQAESFVDSYIDALDKRDKMMHTNQARQRANKTKLKIKELKKNA